MPGGIEVAATFFGKIQKCLGEGGKMGMFGHGIQLLCLYCNIVLGELIGEFVLGASYQRSSDLNGKGRLLPPAMTMQEKMMLAIPRDRRAAPAHLYNPINK